MTKEERLEKLEDLLERHMKRVAHQVEIGEFTYGVPNVRKWNENTRLTIGKFCSIGANVEFLLGGEHHTDYCTTYPFDVLVEDGETMTKGDITVGNDVWIGNEVKILSGVTIGDGAVIGTGAVVTKDVLPYMVVGGVPAKLIKWRMSSEHMEMMFEMQWWDWPLDKIAEALPLLMSKDVDGLYRFYQEVVLNG